jgi:hypothetical protein
MMRRSDNKSNFFTLIGLAVIVTANSAYAGSDNELMGYKSCGKTHGALLEVRNVSFPSVGLDTEAEVGQSMISAFTFNLMNGVDGLSFSISKPIIIKGSHAWQDFEATIPPQAPIEGVNRNMKIMIEDYIFKYANESSPRGSFTRPYLQILIDSSEKSLVATLDFGMSKKTFPVDVAVSPANSEKCILAGDNSLKRELVYSGVSQGAITLLYREFKNDFARPAFSQELRYDLKEGDEIGYKGARFKVKRASNLGIVFSAIRHMQ